MMDEQLERMFQALEQADQAGNAQDASAIAQMIREYQQQAQQPPAEQGLPDISIGEALQRGAPRLGEQVMEGLGGMAGSLGSAIEDPSRIGPGIDRRLDAVANAITGAVENPIATGKGIYQNLKDTYGGWKEIKNTIATDPARLGVDLISLASGGTGLAAKGLGAASRARAVGSTAREAGLPAPAFKSLYEVLGGPRLDEARAKAIEIGPDVAAYNLTPGAESKAAALMSVDLGDEGRKVQRGLYDVAMDQIGGAAKRFREGSLTALGTEPMSRLEALEDVRPAKARAGELYKQAGATRIDIVPITRAIEKAEEKFGNDPDMLTALRAVRASTYNVVTDKVADMRKEAKNTRRDIRNQISKFAKDTGRTLDDKYRIGLETEEGRALNEIYQVLNEQMRQNPEWAAADELHAGAMNQLAANKLGRLKTLGPKSIAPDELVAKSMTMSPEELRAGKAGLAYALARRAGTMQQDLRSGTASLTDLAQEDPKTRMKAWATPEEVQDIADLAMAQGTLAKGAHQIEKADIQRERQIGERGTKPPGVSGPDVKTAVAGAVGYGALGLPGVILGLGLPPVIERALTPGFRKRATETLKLAGRKDRSLAELLNLFKDAGHRKKKRNRLEDKNLLKAMGLVPLLNAMGAEDE